MKSTTDTTASSKTSKGRSAIGQVALVGLSVTALTTAQLTASKLLSIPLPSAVGELPFVGMAIPMPGAALVYTLTFFASNYYSELYGRRAAQVMVNVGFAMNFVLLGLVWSTAATPATNPEFAVQLATVLSSGTDVVAGSLLAYLVSQNWNVIVFHGIRELTDNSLLWLRNIVSTATSQTIDTVIFVGVGFYAAPTVLGIGDVLPWNVLVGLVVGQYLLKLLIAIVDTPFVYGIVALLCGDDESSTDSWVAN